mgnify:CR=1 FL=1
MDVTLDHVIDSAMQLPLEQQQMLLEILQNRQIEARRQEIARDAQASLAAFRAGKLQGQTAAEIISCGYDCRIIFSLESDPETGEEMLVLLDVGTHDEVY